MEETNCCNLEETIPSLLSEWGLSEVLPECQRFFIDIESLRYMQEDDLKILIPDHKLGLRIKFRQRLKEWKIGKGFHSNLLNGFSIPDTTISNDMESSDLLEEITKSNSNNDAMEHETVKDDISESVSESNSEQGDDPLRDPSFDIADDNDDQMHETENTEELRDTIRNALSSTKSSPHKRIRRVFQPPHFNLSEILKRTHKGHYVQAYFARHNKLDSEARRNLVDAICEYFMISYKHMSIHDIDYIANEIVRMFPLENKETYYIPKTKHTNAKGKLLNKYNNSIRNMRKVGLGQRSYNYIKVPPPVDEPEGDTELNDSTIDADLIDIKIWLKSNFEPWPKVIEKWKITCEKRVNIFKKKRNSIDDLVKEWPSFTKLRGYQLIEIDFDELHVDKSNMLFCKWNTFLLKIMTTYSKDIRDAKSKVLLNDIAISKDIAEDAFNCIVAYLLGALLRQRQILKNKDGELWKPTITECQNSFIMHIENTMNYNDAIEEYKNKCETFGMDFHPIIVAVGEQIRSVEVFYVHFNNFNYKFKSFLKALDICFKMYLVLNIPYPRTSELIWLYIQKFIYEIETKYDTKSASLSAFISDMNI